MKRLDPGSEQWEDRRAKLLAEEMTQPKRWYWLSFADADLPPGEQFLGATIVQAKGVFTATQETWLRCINPGGSVLTQCLDDVVPPPTMCNRLLSKSEAIAFAKMIESGEVS